MIKPTVGRKVWYRPSEAEKLKLVVNGDAPLDATVVAVHGDHCVNLACFDANGTPFTRTSVYLVQEGVPKPDYEMHWAEWMPYQTTQAKKHEAETPAT